MNIPFQDILYLNDFIGPNRLQYFNSTSKLIATHNTTHTVMFAHILIHKRPEKVKGLKIDHIKHNNKH